MRLEGPSGLLVSIRCSARRTAEQVVQRNPWRTIEEFLFAVARDVQRNEREALRMRDAFGFYSL